MVSMPKINLDNCNLTTEERVIAERILNKGQLRASKPAIKYTIKEQDCYPRRIRVPDELGGKAAYVWRMVAFSISPKPQHQCMPMTADFDLPGDYTETRELAKELDKLVDKIIASVPKSEWYGVRRWGQAFGMVGSPQVTEEGAVVYC